MRSRENRSNDRNPSTSKNYDSAPPTRFINGERYVKVAVPFGEGYAYELAEDQSVQLPTSNKMADKFRAAVVQTQMETEQTADDAIPVADKIEKLERAIRGHNGMGQDLHAQLEAVRAQHALDIEREQAQLDQAAYLEMVSAGKNINTHNGTTFPNSSPIAKPSGAQYDTWENEGYDTVGRKLPRKRMSRRKIGAIGLVGALAVGGGGALANTTTPDGLFAAFIGQDKSNPDEHKEILALPTAALVDAFGGCLDDNGAGAALIELPVTSKTEVNYNYTSSKNTPKVLETNIHDENDALVKAHAKPVIIASNAPAKVTACVVEADRGSVIVANENTVTVDLSKVSPQLYQDVKIPEIARGFAVSDTVADPMSELWPISDIIDGNVEAGKTRPDTEEKMTPEIGAGILKNYNDNNNIVAEIRQAQVKMAEALVRPGGGYAEKINAFLKERIVSKIMTKASELKQQGLTDIDSPNVIFISEAKKIVEKNPDAPKADSFKLADTVQITAFPDKLAIDNGEVKK